jgi:hypothetical protein
VPAVEVIQRAQRGRGEHRVGLHVRGDLQRLGVTITDPTPDEQRLADLELRTEQERATFDLYEHRRLAVETQATALTAAALTVGGLLLLGFDDLSGLGDVPEWGVPVALVGLTWALVCASLARFGSWDTPTKYGGPRQAYHGEVKRTLDALRDATEKTASDELRQLAHAHWKARAESAWKLGQFKFERLRLALWGLVLPVLYLLVIAGALVYRAV